MSNFEEHIRYLEWLKEFELFDPEPELKTKVKDAYEIEANKGRIFGEGWHFQTEEVDNHMSWHRRMTDKYMLIKEDLD